MNAMILAMMEATATSPTVSLQWPEAVGPVASVLAAVAVLFFVGCTVLLPLFVFGIYSRSVAMDRKLKAMTEIMAEINQKTLRR